MGSLDVFVIGRATVREQPRLAAESAAAARNLACAAELRDRLDEMTAGRDEMTAGRDELAASLAVAERCAGLTAAAALADRQTAADELRAVRRELAESEAQRAHLECRIERAAETPEACRPNDTGDGGRCPGPLGARVADLEASVRARDDRMCRLEAAVKTVRRGGGGRAKADDGRPARRRRRSSASDAALWALVHKYSASTAVAPANDGGPMRARLDALKRELDTLRDDVRDVLRNSTDKQSAGSRVLCN